MMMIKSKEKNRSVLQQLKQETSSPRRLREAPLKTNIEIKYKGNRSLSKNLRSLGGNRRSSNDLKKFRKRLDNSGIANYTINNIDNDLQDSSDNSSYSDSENSSENLDVKVQFSY